MKPAENCPLNKFKPCKKLDCAWYTQVRGQDPNTGSDVDSYGCAIAWMPVLMIENSSQSRQTGASIDSFRNAMVEQGNLATRLMVQASKGTDSVIKDIEFDG
jgi:hypothetical protein